MQSKAKSNSVVTTGYDAEARQWTWTVAGIGTLRLSRDTIHADIAERGLIEGVSDRVVDKAALPFNKAENRYATPQEKYDAMAGLVNHYASGSAQWNIRTASDGDASPALIIEAFMRVKACTHAEAVTRIQAQADLAHGGDVRKTHAFLRTAVDIRRALLAIQTERLAAVAPVMDADAALGEM